MYIKALSDSRFVMFLLKVLKSRLRRVCNFEATILREWFQCNDSVLDINKKLAVLRLAFFLWEDLLLNNQETHSVHGIVTAQM